MFPGLSPWEIEKNCGSSPENKHQAVSQGARPFGMRSMLGSM
jgi:hypothetical protein